MTYRIGPLDGEVDRSAFRCGQAPLDDYIRCYAAQDVRRAIARVFVATPTGEPNRVAGFFSLSDGAVGCDDLPPELARRLPRYPVPVALLGRLAVDQAFQGRGLGSILLADACRKVAHASAVLAVAALVVDAKDSAAADFYRHFGFVPLPGEPGRLLLPWKVLQRTGQAPADS
ncbi:GNAT family N-acetyltransferase [Thiococcus pfennigii]|nr:GNAT family N-acetyltransferase [Thiococcus pfennigii]